MPFSIDEPRMSADVDASDEELDIVVSGRSVTDRDRDLLRADDEVVQALAQKSPSTWSGGARSKLASLLPQRKIKFAEGSSSRGEYRAVGGKKFLGSQRLDNLSRTRRGSSGLADLDDDDDFGLDDDEDEDDGDIEIDLETQPTRRRGRGNSNRTFLYALFLFLAFGSLWIITSGWSSPPSNEHKKVDKPVLSNGTHQFFPTTLVVSLDGFHPHYVSEELTPNLHELFVHHSGVPYMVPSFPSSTFPNHWTLVTGLYPAHHGIIGNTFFDTKIGKQFYNTKPAQSLSQYWWGGEPIWQTASFQGVQTAVHMWPGSEVNWAEGGPIHVDAYNASELLSSKRDRVFQWLDEPDLAKRPELVLTYVPEVDTIGHLVGISGPEIRTALQDVDTLVGLLRQGIEDRNLGEIVNFIVVSDHGMAPTSNDRVVFLEDLVDMNTVEHTDGWPLVALRLKEETTDLVKSTYEHIKSQESVDPDTGLANGWRVFLREQLPREWNFGGSLHSDYDSRFAPLWLIPEVGWSITTRPQLEEMGGTYKPFGVHGYNNTEALMRALFLGTGPYFKASSGVERNMYEPIPNVDIYNILCDTLGLTPASTDGAPVRRALQPLPRSWVDTQAYPGVSFHTEILKVNSTYDVLFGPQHVFSETMPPDNSTLPPPASSSQSEKPGPSTTTPDASSTTSPSIADHVNDAVDKVKGWFSDAMDSVKGWLNGFSHDDSTEE